MRRVVADVAPRYVFAENVARRAIDAAADDLEEMGYQTRAVSLSAADVGADHVRERYWLLAYADDKSKLLSSIDAEMGGLQEFRAGVWEACPDESGLADGLAYRVERFDAAGNGQVPAVALAALRILAGS
jgi:DNA (cytosine-5)-methyltransferase 1